MPCSLIAHSGFRPEEPASAKRTNIGTRLVLKKLDVDRLTYNPAGPQQQIIYDDDVAGFGVRIYPSGSKSFVLAPVNSNPCTAVKRYREGKRERFLTVAEVGSLSQALYTALTAGLPPAPRHQRKPGDPSKQKHRPKEITPIPANPAAVAAIRFLLLTGWRSSEARNLRWSDVDFARKMATLRETKTGKSHRPLGAPALALLSELPRVSEFVFPGDKPGTPLRDMKRVWGAVRYAAGLEDVRLHDLRHTVASFAVASGHSLYVTGSLLGHARAATTQRYAHLHDDARHAAADTVSSVIAEAMKVVNAQ